MLFVCYPKCTTCKKAEKWLQDQYDLLATDGMLVKRPILVTEDKVLVGFREKEWSQGV